MKTGEIKYRIADFISQVHSWSTIVLVAGISALLLGILVDNFIFRLICLAVVLAAAFLFFYQLRLHEISVQPLPEEALPRPRPSSKSNGMKKLIFDDSEWHGDSRKSFDSVDDHLFDGSSFTVTSRAQTMTAPRPTAIPAREVRPSSGAQHDFRVADFFDANSEIYRADAEPRTEFDYLLLKVLNIVKEILFANTVAFFWANREKQQMVLEARLTDSKNFMTSRRFPIGSDLVSKVALTGHPELVSDLNQNSLADLLPYYQPVTAVKSFVGVPVYFVRPNEDPAGSEPVGVIVIDGVAADEFGHETLLLLGHHTKLVSALIKSYTEKYDLLLESELLHSIRRLQDKIRREFTLSAILQALSEEASKLVNFDCSSVVLYDETRRAWLASKVTQRTQQPYLAQDQPIDFPESIVGQTIKHTAHALVDDLDAIAPPRYYAGEKLGMKGSFVSVPISSLKKCYGALNVDSKEKYSFSRQDADVLTHLADIVGGALEIFYATQLVREYVIIDDVTGLFSKRFFLQRVAEELLRADETDRELSMVFVTIDKAEDVRNRFGDEGFEHVLLTIAGAIRNCVRSYDVVGRYDPNRFGIILVDTPANDAYLWAEKIRKNVAGHVINLDGRGFSVTISAGVCGALEGVRKEELIGNTTAVLNRAIEAGGNSVRVF